MKRGLVIAGAMVLAGLGWPTRAHDLRGALVQQPSGTSRQIALALEHEGATENVKSVLNNLRLWPVRRRLTICFLSGSMELRSRVAKVMRTQWPIGSLSGGNLDFDTASFNQLADCGAPAKADIRVDFQAGKGHWSYVGIESLDHVPSMNFDNITSKTEVDFQTIVTHEMGHALGLEHEHQNPGIPKACGWDYDFLWAHYNWASEADMHANLDQLQDTLQRGQHAYTFSSYDKRSNMHYSFEAAAFTQGKQSPCFIEQQNSTPSDKDRAAIQVAYTTGSGQPKAVKGMAEDLKKLYGQPAYAGLRRLIDLKASLAPQ